MSSKPTASRSPAVSGPMRRISDSEIWRLVGEFTQIIWRASPDGQSIVAPTWTAVTGQSEQEVQDGGWLLRVHEDDRERVIHEWAETIRGGTELSTEFRLELHDGRYEWFRSRAEPLRNQRGRIKGWIGITSSIDEQKRTDVALTESAARLRLIVDAARVGTLDWDLASDEIDVNPRGLELLGATDSTLTTDLLETLVEPEDRPRFRQALDQALDPSGPGTFEAVFRVRRPDRLTAWIGVRGAVRYPDSSFRTGGPRLLGVLTDLTHERFRDAQLREAQKLDAVGQLAGGVAHDLNNILTAMMAGVHLAIQHGELDERTERRLAQVRAECHRASTVIRELLAFGRKQLVTPTVCRPADIVRECQPMLARLIGEDIELDFDLGGSHGMLVDRAQMVQVIVSLAVHARDSMPTGGRLSITTADEPNHVLIEVADTGMGVTAETRARLFEPYFTTRKLGWGTGLGLSVVHGIVSQFGGEIEVDSAPGEGSTFTMRFAAHAAPPRTISEGPPTPRELHGRETILLVEDEQVLRNQLADSLRDLGYTILEARNGYDALAVLEAHSAPVHLILSDVIMPEMNGVSLVAQLREWYPNIRVLFITGYSEEAVASYGVLVSNTALLLKPFLIPDLAARIRGVLDGPRQHEVPEKTNGARKGSVR
jgi:PAS domain S-box-containing protein